MNVQMEVTIAGAYTLSSTELRYNLKDTNVRIELGPTFAHVQRDIGCQMTNV